MSNKECPFCGNENIGKKTIKTEDGFSRESDWCSICNKPFGPQVLSKEEVEFLKRNEDQEWKEYAEEYGLISFGYPSLWQKYLWKKNEKAELILDISEENIRKCKQLHDKNPEDEDNFMRLLLINIFAGKECKELTTKFLSMWQKGHNISHYCYELCEYNEARTYRAIEPYIEKLKNFLLWLFELNPNRFQAEISDIEDTGSFRSIFKIIGASMACKVMDAEFLFYSDIYRVEGYLQSYVTAESCYLEKEWFKAFILFEKLRNFNEMNKIMDEDLYNDLKDEIWFFNEILHSPPNVNEIKNRAYECFCNLINSEEKIKLYDLIGKIHLHLRWYWDQILDKDREIQSYLQIYAVFSELMKENYSEAFNKWINWNKRSIKLAGLDLRSVTKSIINLKEGVGNKKDNIKSLLNANPFMEDFGIISDLETKLREFIVENLSRFYGGEEMGWRRGVPVDIRRECASRKEEDENLETPKHSYLNFSDYAKIIEENWKEIFKTYFELEKEDSQKNKEKLTAFLRELVPFRNAIFHGRPLKHNETIALKASRDLFYKIYNKWRCNYK